MIIFLSQFKKIGGGRVCYITELVKEPVDKILDIGCSYGWTIGGLVGKANELWGIDMDQKALSQAQRSYPFLKLSHQTAAKLPFENDMFDVVILSEVIEHVGDENKQLVIDEAWRVLKKGGLFIFTAPYDGLFAWTDHLDFKRRFPTIYKIYMKLANYTPDTPIEVGHKHLSMREIKQLFNYRFEITSIKFCGFFMPLINWLLSIGVRLKLLPSTIENLLNRLQDWESGVNYPNFLAFNIRLTAYKK